MPKEWNEMVNAMQGNEMAGQYQKENVFRMAEPEEISKPQWFVHFYQSPDWVECTHISVLASTILGWNESEDHIRAMWAKYEKPIQKTSQQLVEERLPWLQKNKGKCKECALTKEDFPHLCQQWHDEFEDIVNGTHNNLPLWREVNHEIHLIDDDKQYKYFTPHCPNSLHEQLHTKINCYVESGWWEPRSVLQAAPLLCIPKKDRKLRTIINVQQQNDNVIKDVTPLPDQEAICEDVAWVKYCSKIDLTDAYEQVCVHPEDVEKNVFATITRTFISHIMWIGDCNTPATFQCLITSIFWDAIGHSMHVYLDNIFIYSNTIEEHEEHLQIVFERLRQQELYMKWEKCKLYADKIDCLRHTIDNEGIHVDIDKVAWIKDWRTPCNYNDIQQFIGLVNYIGNFLPDIMVYTRPLLAMMQNGAPFHWCPLHQICFDMIKRISLLAIMDVSSRNMY